jgi:hypothetical protein
MKDSGSVIRADDTSSLWTDRHVAAFLNVSLASVRRWRLTGFGPPFYRVGARIRYNPQECDAWLRSRQVGGAK